ncbi:MAG TPA: L,D-transpeptidase [Aestuariivirga sp.]|nr:L,D-transpeptidase [Aestuariivirga sp.]
MPISRRGFLTSLLASGVLPGRALALSGEPFPVFESDAKQIPYKFRRRDVDYETPEPAGTLLLDAEHRFLYRVLGNGKATRYGVSVGKKGYSWFGEAVIKRMAKWPVWVPTPEHLAAHPLLAKHIHGMPGGPGNPLGARAMYLYQGDVDTVNRIHGSIDPSLIGRPATLGCIGLLNIDVIHLYERVEIGTRVVALPSNG